MITDGEKWHYTALKSDETDDGLVRPTKGLSRSSKGITSNHKGDFYCMNCFIYLEHIILLKNMKNCAKIMIFVKYLCLIKKLYFKI